jgi:hypothetical protein
VERGAVQRLTEGVGTRLGGILYLINLMGHLDLPACFEETWGLASQVGSWGVLEVLGRALLTRPGHDLVGDAIWQALAELDGREAGAWPGHAFRGSDTFRLPAAWLARLDAAGDAAWYWATDGRRLRLWSPQGYLLVDRLCSGGASEARAQAGKERRAYRADAGSKGTTSLDLIRRSPDQAPLDSVSGPLVRGLSPDLIGWLARVLPYLRFRLRRALNPADEAPWNLARALLFVPGRLYVTSSHVDLVMDLDDVSLPVRLAGLDLDPGWLPAFGRVVQFHFE